MEAAATIIRNRHAIVKDAQRRPKAYEDVPFLHTASAKEVDAALRGLTSLLIGAAGEAPDAKLDVRAKFLSRSNIVGHQLPGK